MLSMTNRLGDKVVLMLPDGKTITVEVSRLNSNQVNLGIDAPKNIYISKELAKKELPNENNNR